MNVVLLTGDQQKDRQSLRENWKKPDTVFVLNSDEMLWEYIDRMVTSGTAQLKVRICKELTGLDVDYYEMENANADSVQTIDPKKNRHADTLSGLLSHVNPAKFSYVTVNGDIDANEETRKAVRTRLGEIVQQLVYLQLPLNKIRVRTARDMKTAEIVRVFEKNIDHLQRETEQAIAAMESNQDAFEDKQLWAGTFGSLKRVADSLKASRQDELKIAVAATKKTGKSVIVNSIIEQELAPTSLEQATPNNCVYRRREDQYSLQWKGTFSGFGAGREGASRLHAELTREFEKAQKSKDITIDDMDIGYMLDKSGLTSYVITDTPGPDREGHLNAEEIARKAVRGTDMAIYAIDYAKHLTKDEHKYLEWIVNEFAQKGKDYSLIFDVNRMDSRYQDKGHKSIPRSLDFIRQELIKIDPRFKSCILFGTSALTYFNALAAPQIPGCEALEGENGLAALPELLDKYSEEDDFGGDTPTRDDSDPRTVLNFLSEIVNRLRVFHGVEAKSLDDLKDFSGMKSLLSYVSYVAQEKARTEKLYSLMRIIDREYTDIVNLFHFQELKDALARNRNKVAEVQTVLKEFAEKVSDIFDEDYPEVRRLCRAGEIKSDWIQHYGNMTPFRLADVEDEVIKDFTKSVDIKERVQDLAYNTLPMYLKTHYKDAQSKAGFGRRKTIYGQDEILLGAKDIEECYNKAKRQTISHLSLAIKEKFDEANRQLQQEAEPTAKDLEGIFIARQDKLRELIDEYSRRIWEDYSIPFNMTTPVFNAGLFIEIGNEVTTKIKISQKSLWSMQEAMKKSLENAPLRNKSGNVFSQLIDIVKLMRFKESDIPRMYYDVDAFIRKYREEWAPRFVSDLLVQHIEAQYRDDLDNAVKVRQEYFNEIAKQIEVEEQQTKGYLEYARRALDITGELDREKKQLEKERLDLERIQNAVSGFQGLWSKNRPEQ